MISLNVSAIWRSRPIAKPRLALVHQRRQLTSASPLRAYFSLIKVLFRIGCSDFGRCATMPGSPSLAILAARSFAERSARSATRLPSSAHALAASLARASTWSGVRLRLGTCHSMILRLPFPETRSPRGVVVPERPVGVHNADVPIAFHRFRPRRAQRPLCCAADAVGGQIHGAHVPDSLYVPRHFHGRYWRRRQES